MFSPRNVDSSDECQSFSIVSPTGQLSSTVRLSSNPCQTSSTLSGTIDSPISDQSTTEAVGCFPRDVQSSLSVIIDPLDLSSLNCLESEEQQRRTDHRRNKSEPFASNEDQQTLLNPSSASRTKNKSPLQPPSKTIAKKKSSWFNPFQSTYRQRNEEFKKLFKDLPVDERLIVDYSCAWQKEILIQGRMYLSVHCLCFHANFLKWETSLIVHWKDLSNLTREKTAKVIPNAIELKSNKGEKYFFASFATRDKTFAIAKRLWETNLQDQILSSTEIWKLIGESYGTDLDRTTDDEEEKKDPLPPVVQQVEASPSTKSNRSSMNSSQSRYERFRDQSSLSSRNDDEDDEDLSDDDDGDDQRQQMLPIAEERKSTRMIRTPRSEMEYLCSCPCESSSHLATQLIDRSYPMTVEHLFDCVFGENPFLQAYRASRRVKDFHADPWQINSSSGKRERVCTYKVSVAGVFGATTICSTEKQMIDCELSGSHYLIDTEVRNEGIKYADSFFVASRYCLVQIGEKRSHFKVTSEVRYVKSLMIIIKSFIEKNATAALQDSYTDMMKRLEQESSSRVKTSIDHSKEKTKKKFNKKSTSIEEHSKQKQQVEERNSINDESIQTISLPDPRPSSSSSWTWTGNQFFLLFSFLTMFLLLSVNLFLYMKLNEIDRMTDRLVQSYPQWSKKSSYSSEDDQWAILLQRQEEYYQAKLGGLRSILISTYSALKNVTETLNELSKSSTGSTSSNVYSF